MKRAPRTHRARRRGFTLAEVAVAIVIVGMGLVWILEGLNGAKLTAAHTRNFKLARELALMTLGQIESGEFREDITRGLTGTYAEEGYPDFAFEVILGDEAFGEEPQGSNVFDSWKPRTRAQLDEEEQRSEMTDEEREENRQPFEKLKIRVTFPKIREYTNELVLELWVPWDQVYGESEDAAAADPNAAGGGAAGAAGTPPSSSKGTGSSSSSTKKGGGK